MPVAADRLEPDLTIGPPAPPEVRTAPGERSELVELDEPAHVDESVVRGLLKGIGGALGHVVGDEDVGDHWRFTERELDDLTPPVTRIVNRNSGLRRAVMKGDSITVAITLAGYAGRNVDLARAARKERDELAGEALGLTGDPGANGQDLVGGSHRPDGSDGRHGGGLPGTSGGGPR